MTSYPIQLNLISSKPEPKRIKDYLDNQTFLWRNLPPYTRNPLKKVQQAKKGFFRGLQATMVTQLECTYYRTIDKSEVDLVVEGHFGIVPFAIKLSSLVKRISLPT